MKNERTAQTAGTGVLRETHTRRRLVRCAHLRLSSACPLKNRGQEPAEASLCAARLSRRRCAAARTGERNFLELPGVEHHEAEVGIVVDRRGDAGVILLELLERQRAVGVGVERVEELLEHFVNGLLARNDLRVLARVVQLLDVVQPHKAVAGDVELAVRALDQSLSVLVQLAAEGDKELVEGDRAVVALVVLLEDQVDLAVGEAQAVVLQALLELRLVERLVAVVVVDAERAGDLLDAELAAALDGLLDLLVHGLVRARHFLD